MVKFILKSVLILGILLRIYLQFYTPSFNVDEIALGENIKARNITELLYPLENFQTAPPLYLLTQKLFIYLPFKFFWVKIKIFSFLISAGIITLIYKLAPQLFKKGILAILFLAFFCFSPFVVYNTLTVKQYGVDLFFLIFLYIQLQNSRSPQSVSFIIGSLFSHIGLFFTAGYLFIQLVSVIKTNRNSLFQNNQFFNLRNLSIAIGPIICILYFVWFMQQNGAIELKIFMQDYWKDSFIPLNLGIFHYLLYFINGIIVYFVSSYVILGLSIFLIAFFGVIYFKKLYQLHFSNKFLISGIIIHVILNIFHLYPLSDRLYLYLALPIYIIFLKGIETLLENISAKWLKLFLYGATASLILTYATYLPYRENDLLSLFNYLDQQIPKKIVYSDRAFHTIESFNNFTDKKFIKSTNNNSSALIKGNLFVSRVHHKYGHKEKTSKEENQTSNLIDSGVLKIIHKVDGFNIYEIQ